MTGGMGRAGGSLLAGMAIFLLAWTGTGWANDIQVTATVDKTTLSLEDSIQLSITVRGSQSAETPELPPLPDFRVISTGTSSSTQIINADIQVSLTFSYQLLPLKEGQFTLRPARVVVDGKTYSTEPIPLTVAAPRNTGRARNVEAFVETYVSNAKPFVNEQVVYTFKLYRKADAQNLNLDMPYDQQYFRKMDLGKSKRYTQVINGVEYEIHELSVALFPIKPGRVELPPALLEMDLLYRSRQGFPGRSPFDPFFDDPFFGSRSKIEHKVLRSKPISLEIQPLPEKDKPANFSGLVGQFDISESLSKTELETGDTTTLTLTLTGTGNIGDAANPMRSLDRQGFKIYEDQPAVETSIHDTRITGKKTFKLALVPTVPGTLTIPPVVLNYFDPRENSYRRAETGPLTLKVLPGRESESLHLADSNLPVPQSGEGDVKILGKDILPIHTRLSDFEDQSLTASETWVYLALLLLPAVLYGMVLIRERTQQRMKVNPAYYRSREAFKLFQKQLKGLSPVSGNDPRPFVRELSQIVREYIGNKLNLKGTAFTSVEVESRLKERHIQPDQAAKARALLEKYEALQFAPVVQTDKSRLIDESIEVLKELERIA